MGGKLSYMFSCTSRVTDSSQPKYSKYKFCSCFVVVVCSTHLFSSLVQLTDDMRLNVCDKFQGLPHTESYTESHCNFAVLGHKVFGTSDLVITYMCTAVVRNHIAIEKHGS